MKAKRIVSMFVLLFTGSVGLWAFGQVELQDVPGTITGTYDYNTELVVSEQLTVVNGGTDPVNYYVTFGAGSSGDVSNRTLTDGSGNTLSYQFMDSATTRNVLKNNASARTTDDVLAGSLAGSAQESRSFDVVVFSGQFPPAGQYTDSLVITAYSGTVGSGQFSTFGFTTVDVTVPSVVELSLVDTGAPFDPTQSNYIVDFGVLSAGATRQLDMLVRSNETFGVSIESQNAGVMAIQTAGDSSTVPYQLSVNGSAVDLSSGNPVSVLSSVGPTVLAGQRYPISVEIQDYGFATDGIYQDNLTITVTAQ